jgi:hypothetical protein
MTETRMPTRTDVHYRVLLVLFKQEGGWLIVGDGPEIRANRFTDPRVARAWADSLLATAHSNDLIYTIRREETERNASPEECTDEELCQAWRVWREMDNLPMQYDEMDVTDPYLNFPGDMEMYSDMFNEYAKEYTRRHEDSDLSISDVA